MAAILLPATCVLAPVFAYFHALTVPKVFLPPTIVNVSISADCKLALPMLFPFHKLAAVYLILLVKLSLTFFEAIFQLTLVYVTIL